jgi:acyl transferase domain-containing protein/phosphopantetheinyl transferase
LPDALAAAVRRPVPVDDGGAAIVGMACLLPGAPDLETFWANLLGGVDAITDVPHGRWDPLYYDPDADAPERFYCRRGGFVDDIAGFDPTEFGIMPLAVDGAEPDQLLALGVAARALADAGDPHRSADPTRVGVIIGRGGYIGSGVRRLEQRVHTAEQLVVSLRSLLPDVSEAQLASIKAEFVDRLGPARSESAIDLVPNLTASRISNRLDLRGPSHTVDAACASSLVAVDQALDQLASGRCDVVVAGGVHHCHDLTLWSVFTQLGAISRRQEVRAFDRGADGLLIGEGTVMLVLKRLADAERDGDRVYAVIRGVGVASDGRATSLMSPSVEGQVLAVERAWQRAGLDPASIGLLEAHGTGTPTGDEVELHTLRRVFGAAGPTAGLGTVKSMIGHAMPAAGAAGIAKAALAVFHGQLPPTLHAEDPHLLVAATRFRLVQETQPWEGAGPRVAGVDAFGFGGINAHVVLEEHLGSTGRSPGRSGSARRAVLRPVGRTEPAEELLLVAGASVDEVLERLADAGSTSTGELAVHGGGPVRLAVVEPSAKRLALAEEVVRRGRPFHGRSDVWFQPTPLVGPQSAGGQVAFVFPGLEPNFTPRLEDVAARLDFDTRRIVGDTSTLEVLGPAVIDTGRVLHQALAQLGVHPDLVAGHSIGEWTAQIAAGMTPVEALEPLLDQLRPGVLDHPDVAYLALGCGVDVAGALIDGVADIVISHDNCPHQSVVCGTDAAVAEVGERARQRHVLAQELPFRSGFHTPMFEPYLGAMAELFGALPVRTPSVPVWSAASGRPYPDDPDAVRALTVEHLTTPVRFGPLVSRLYEDGVRVFVELGVGSLVGFVDDTLGAQSYLAVAANSAKCSGLAQLRRTSVALWCAGVEVSLPALGDLGSTAPQRPEAPPRRLRLGSPLVRGLTPLQVEQTSPPARSAADTSPVLSAFDAALNEASSASTQVLRRWQERARPARPRRLERPERFALQDQAVWGDHAIFSQPSGWADQSDRFPIVPLTAMIERFVELASELRPDLVPVGLEDVRAMRWLVVEPPTTTAVSAEQLGDADGGQVKVRTDIGGHARATVLMAERYPTRPAPRLPAHRERPLPYPPRAIYADRWLFHGPAYQGIEEITGWDDRGIDGEVRALAAPGALLDNAGQVLGLWVALALPERRTVLPTTIDRISFYGPAPAVGQSVRCVAEATSVQDDAVVADLELVGRDGLWARIEGWTERRFDTTNTVFEAIRSPQDHLVSTVSEHGWAWAVETWLDPASREMIMRRYLNAAERAAYERRNPRAQRASLLGRIALKDLLRHRHWQAHTPAAPVFPAEITVSNDADGRPEVSGALARGLRVSLAHSGGVGVAWAAPGIEVGIDVEKVGERPPRFAEAVLTEREQTMVARMTGSMDERLTTLWALKEAAAKAEGTGLAGRPRAWEVEQADDGRYRVGRHHLASAQLVAPHADRPSEDKEKEVYIVAWTVPES